MWYQVGRHPIYCLMWVCMAKSCSHGSSAIVLLVSTSTVLWLTIFDPNTSEMLSNCSSSKLNWSQRLFKKDLPHSSLVFNSWNTTPSTTRSPSTGPHDTTMEFYGFPIALRTQQKNTDLGFYLMSASNKPSSAGSRSLVFLRYALPTHETHIVKVNFPTAPIKKNVRQPSWTQCIAHQLLTSTATLMEKPGSLWYAPAVRRFPLALHMAG